MLGSKNNKLNKTLGYLHKLLYSVPTFISDNSLYMLSVYNILKYLFNLKIKIRNNLQNHLHYTKMPRTFSLKKEVLGGRVVNI